MNNALIPFDYKGNEIRVIEQDGKVLFCGKDIATALEYRDTVSAIKRHCRGVAFHHPIVDSLGREQQARFITEGDVYRLIASSKLPAAQQFEAWIFDEVLPSIRQRGGYINPNANEHQLNALIRQAQMRMELIQSARGIIDPKHLEVKARVVLAQGLGEAPQVPATDVPLYAADFLKSKNLSDKQRRSKAGLFGKALKKAYIELHGREPGVYLLNLSNGQTRPVCAYTEADRPLMERVWRELTNHLNQQKKEEK